MSHIGKKTIQIPENVLIILKNNKIIISGKYGSLEKPFFLGLNLIIENNQCNIVCQNNTKIVCSLQGLMRTLIQNMILGVNQQICKSLILKGVGYKFQLDNNYLLIHIGYTNVIKVLINNNINLILESSTKLIIKGIDKEYVGFFASKIRSIRPPEPYKGKGILYFEEKIKRKIGKANK